MTKGTLLCIDASSPCGASGINAAIKTAHAFGGYAMSALTCVGVQTMDQMLGIYPVPPVVVDPILSSRDGKRFLDKVAIDALKRRILPYTDLLLPNVHEAETLTGDFIKDETQLDHIGEMLMTLGPRNVFIKGKNLNTDHIYEVYVDDRRTQVFTRERATGRPMYGAGAALASAVAILIAQGNTPRQAVIDARDYIEEIFIRNPDLLTDAAGINIDTA